MIINYRNVHLRKQVEKSAAYLKYFAAAVLICLGAIVLSFYGTYKDIYHGWHIHTDRMEGYSEIIYTAEITQAPEELTLGYYIIYVDGDPILAKNLGNASYNVRETGRAKIRGVFRSVPKEDREISEAAQEYFIRNSPYPKERRERAARFCFDCSGVSFGEVLLREHRGGLIFGVINLGVIGLLMHLAGTAHLIRHRRPDCGNMIYSPEEIDQQADMPGALWFEDEGVCLARDIIIGTQKGMTAVEYREVKRIYFKARPFRDWVRKISLGRRSGYGDCEDLMVLTDGGRRLTLSRSGASPELRAALTQRCGSGVWTFEKEVDQ